MLTARSAFLSLDEDNPVNWDHPLNAGLATRIQVFPGSWYGGAVLRDLAKSKNVRNNGSVIGGPGWEPSSRTGGYGQLRLDGSNDMVQMGDPSALDPTTGSFTCCIWVSFTVTGTTFAFAKTSFGNGYDMLLSGGSVSLRVTGGSTAQTSSTSVNDGRWHHVVGICDRSAQLIYLVVDGVQIGSSVSCSSVGDISNTISLNLGARGGGGSNFLAGRIDEFCFWNRALTVQEARQLYNESRSGSLNTLNWPSRRSYSFAAGGGGGARIWQLASVGASVAQVNGNIHELCTV